jgi:hypothetical protein
MGQARPKKKKKNRWVDLTCKPMIIWFSIILAYSCTRALFFTPNNFKTHKASAQSGLFTFDVLVLEPCTVEVIS